jgi:ABC-type lipoprotein export system ATPase subunit
VAGTNGDAVLTARGLVKEYGSAGAVQRVLDGVDLTVASGQFVSIMGPSGSGKSTLLHLLGGLDHPDAGEVELGSKPFSTLSDDERTRLRRGEIGIVYQFFNLVPVLTAEENIALPAVIAGRSEQSYRARLDHILELVGLGEHRTKQPAELSGGQQQRAAIGRALFIEPSVLLADEPTGNLDLRTGSEILDLFADAQQELGQTIVMVTHDPRGAAYADQVLLLREGRVASNLDVAQRCRGAARTDRTHESRSRAVLRWLEQLDAGTASRQRVSVEA